MVVHSLEDALEKSSKYQVVSSMYEGKEKEIHDTKYMIPTTEHEVFIIGGGQVWKEALEKNLVDRLYLTIVEARLPSGLSRQAIAGQGDYNADTFFPDYSNFTKIISEEQGESVEYKYRFVNLERG